MNDFEKTMWKFMFSLNAGVIMGMLLWSAATKPIGFVALLSAYTLGAVAMYTYHKAMRRQW